MAATLNKRPRPTKETKFVSLFADSRPDVDVTFKDAVLNRSTSHYIVGVDNLTISSKALSMIEPVTNGCLIRVFRKPTQTHANVAGTLADLQTKIASGQAKTAAQMDAATFGKIDSTEVITNVQHLMERLSLVADAVNAAMSNNQAAGAGFVAYTRAADESLANVREHLSFKISRSGSLVIEGDAAFWACCAIEIDSTRNQFGLLGTRKKYVGQLERYTKRRVLIVDPQNATRGPTFGNLLAYKHTDNTIRYLAVGTATNGGAGEANTTLGAGTANQKSGAHADSQFKSRVELEGDLMQFDRRIAVELGTSLPIKNSPMIDHQKEHPDFVIGRWMYRPNHRYTIAADGSNPVYSTGTNSTIEYQNATDRVIYHELMPQNKVQVLRVKLFARVRDFDEQTETYSIRTIGLPTALQDWWHCRLHFVTKD